MKFWLNGVIKCPCKKRSHKTCDRQSDHPSGDNRQENFQINFMEPIKTDAHYRTNQAMRCWDWNPEFAGKKYSKTGRQFHAKTAEKNFRSFFYSKLKLISFNQKNFFNQYLAGVITVISLPTLAITLCPRIQRPTTIITPPKTFNHSTSLL